MNHRRSSLLLALSLLFAGCMASKADSMCKVCTQNRDCPEGLVCASVSCGVNACVIESDVEPGHPWHGEIDRKYECPSDGAIYHDDNHDGRYTEHDDFRVICDE